MSFRIPPYNFRFNGYTMNCVEPIDLCLPAYEVHDFLSTNFITTNENVENLLGFGPVVRYGMRIVTKCNEPIVYDGDPYNEDNPYTQYPLTNPVIDLLASLVTGSSNEILLSNTYNPLYEAFFYGPLYAKFASLAVNECFFIQILKAKRIQTPTTDDDDDYYTYVYDEIVTCSKCLKKIEDPCYTTKIYYRNNENAFGFAYGATPFDNGTFESVRLPLYLTQPQFPTQRNVFTLSNGTKKKLSSRIEKEWQCETDYMPKEWHERLVIALEHDTIWFNNENSGVTKTVLQSSTLGESNIILESEYQIEWQRFLDYPTAQGKFKIKEIPYNNVNSNCL